MKAALLNLILLFCFCNTTSVAQTDSMLQVIQELIKTAKSDTTLCDAYLFWGEQVYMSNSDTALILFKKTEEIANKNLKEGNLTKLLEKEYQYYKALSLNNIGFIYTNQTKLDLALEYHLKSLEIKKEMDDKGGMGSSYNNIGLIYGRRGETQKALDYHRQALVYREETGNKGAIANSLNNIGVIYESYGDIENALAFYYKALKLQEELEDKRGAAYCLNNIAHVYTIQDDLDKALEINEQSLALREELGDKYGMAQSQVNIGAIYKKRKEYEQALIYYRRSLSIKEEIGDLTGVAISLHHISGVLCAIDSAEAGVALAKKSIAMSLEQNDLKWVGYTTDFLSGWYLKAGKIDSAERYGLMAMELAEKLEFPLNIRRATKNLVQIYKRRENWELALEMYELHIQMKDSIKNEETQKASIRQQTKYEFEKAQLVKDQEEKEIKRLEDEARSRRDNLQYSIILLGLLVLGALVLGLGRLSLSDRLAEGLIFFSFLILFEFLLVLADPYIEGWSNGAPGIKLLFNAGIAALIFPLHAFFESTLKSRLVK